MSLREHLSQNRLAISACLISVLGAVAIWRRSQEQPPAPLPRPRPPSVQVSRPPPGPAFKIQLTPIKADAERGVAGLDIGVVFLPNSQGRVTAYYIAQDAAAGEEPVKRAVQTAWDSIRPQLPATGPTAVHLVVLSKRPDSYLPEPPAAGTANVLAHGLVTPPKDAGPWAETISEWR